MIEQVADIPKPVFAGEFFWGSVGVPALASAEVIVPVLHGQITVIGTGDTLVSAARVILHRDGCTTKVGRARINLNA